MEQRLREQQHKRKPPFRNPYPRILIVCEGEKTEPIYFESLKNDKRLLTAQIKVVGTGFDPKTIVEEAKKHKIVARKEPMLCIIAPSLFPSPRGLIFTHNFREEGRGEASALHSCSDFE